MTTGCPATSRTTKTQFRLTRVLAKYPEDSLNFLTPKNENRPKKLRLEISTFKLNDLQHRKTFYSQDLNILKIHLTLHMVKLICACHKRSSIHRGSEILPFEIRKFFEILTFWRFGFQMVGLLLWLKLQSQPFEIQTFTSNILQCYGQHTLN